MSNFTLGSNGYERYELSHKDIDWDSTPSLQSFYLSHGEIYVHVVIDLLSRPERCKVFFSTRESCASFRAPSLLILAFPVAHHHSLISEVTPATSPEWQRGTKPQNSCSFLRSLLYYSIEKCKIAFDKSQKAQNCAKGPTWEVNQLSYLRVSIVGSVP